MQYFSDLDNIIRGYLSAEQADLVKESYFFAKKAHDGQFRSSGEPYITHPVSVATILANMKLDYEAVIAALMHDTIEDTPVTFQNIADKFGRNVANLVEGVSKLDKLKFRNRQEAQAENFRKMVLAMTEDVRVILIKLADRTHNMRTLGALRPDKRRRIAKETLEIYAPLAHRLGIHHIKTELEVLSFSAMHPNRAAVIKKVIDVARGMRKNMISTILFELKTHLAEVGITAEVTGFEKNIYSIYQKMKLHEQNFHSIMDIYIFRIIVKDVDSCYRVLGLVHNMYKPRVNHFRDYIAIPKVNGYQSLHSSLIASHGTPVDVQICTENMHQMAEMGVVAYWNYGEVGKYDHTETQLKAQGWMQSLLELQQSVGNSFEFIENVKSDFFPKEIYVFTPKGRIVGLPEGATAVDLAYAVHSNIGEHCIGAIVDRKQYPLSQPLQSGQTVEIQTSPSAHPNASWLSFVASSKARAKIRQSLKTLKYEEAIVLGRRLLNLVLTDEKDLDCIPTEKIDHLVSFMQLPSFDHVLAEIGFGNLMSQFVAKSLEHGGKQYDILESDKRLTISGTEGMLVSFAKCCYPIPVDPIIGQMNSDKGLVVHHECCRNLIKYRKNTVDYIPLQWAADVSELFIAKIWIDIFNNQGAFANILSVINGENAHVQWLNTEEKNSQTYTIILQIEIKNSVHLQEIMRKIALQDDVISVSRNIN